MPEPEEALLSIALTPRTPADRRKLERALQHLTEQDRLLCVKTAPDTDEVIIAGTGELHLENALDRLTREFHVEAGVGRLQVAYKETITRFATGEMKYVGQAADGCRQYAHVKLQVMPEPCDSGHAFQNALLGGVLPPQFIPAIEQGVREGLAHGVIAGYPLVNLRIALYDASYHDVDSAAAAFRIAGALALRNAVAKAGPVLLEPVMRVALFVSEADRALVSASLSRRGGKVESWGTGGATIVVTALVPLAGMLGFAGELQAQTGGRVTFRMRFEQYAPCPPAEDEDGIGRAVAGVPRRPRPLRTSEAPLDEWDEGGD